MKLFKHTILPLFFAGAALTACNTTENDNKNNSNYVIVKGLYSFGPEMRSFTLCDDGRQFWVADSAKNLELQYNNLGFEKPYTPVYVEVQGYFAKSDTTIIAKDFDSTLVVKKLLKISKDIPEGPCAQ